MPPESVVSACIATCDPALFSISISFAVPVTYLNGFPLPTKVLVPYLLPNAIEAEDWLSSYCNNSMAKGQGEVVDEAMIQRGKVLAIAAIANMEQTAQLLDIEGFQDLNTAKYFLADANLDRTKVMEALGAIRTLKDDPYNGPAYEALRNLFD
ncbi:MAG: hypothetical protein GX352_10030 [Clostridiales bacterium]|nr:hypothetical protein [Clostridiales bacterium]